MFKRFDFFLSTPSPVVVRCTAPIKQQISGGEDIVLRLGHQHSVGEVIGEIRGEGNLAYGGFSKRHYAYLGHNLVQLYVVKDLCFSSTADTLKRTDLLIFSLPLRLKLVAELDGTVVEVGLHRLQPLLLTLNPSLSGHPGPNHPQHNQQKFHL